MDRAWHAEHPMPPKMTAQQRLDWHREHAAACGCRQPPPEIAAILERERAAGDAQRASDG